MQKAIFWAALAIFASGCATFFSSDETDEYAGWSAAQFYNEAHAALQAESYSKAIELYEQLEARYPFGPHATQAQLEIAYAYYKYNEPDSAIAAVDRFIKLYPQDPRVDYAYYLRGLVNFNRSAGFLDRYMPTDASQRDPGPARDAYRDFQELIRKFPDSKYVPDARQRIVALRNNLAMYEIHVARYYLAKGAYIAAADRAAGVVEKYQRTPAVLLALKIMEETYAKLGLDDLAKDAAGVYELNAKKVVTTPEYLQQGDVSFAQKVWDFFGLDR